MARTKVLRVGIVVAGVLAALTLATYWPVLHHGFVSYDDNDYVTQNTHVRSGLTWANVVWAFRAFEAANWHPLTWLSHMLDVQLYGLNAGRHHLTNLLLHLANSLLLLSVLHRMTGAFWRSALVASLFALHPLHVESVAWVAERKDVLSACFFLLTLWAYVRYVEARAEQPGSGGMKATGLPKPSGHGLKAGQTCKGKQASAKPHDMASPGPGLGQPAPGSRSSVFWYGLALVLLALGLMSKQMLVTLPCVLLLLDYWPLQRFQSAPVGLRRPTALRLVREKVPFFVLSVAASTVTMLSQGGGGTVIAVADFGIWDRLSHAGVAYVKYLGKTVWPTDLAVFYPHPFVDRTAQWPAWQSAAAGLLLLCISALVLLRRKRQPWLAVGWLWFLGMLVPVIGLVQVGSQAMADRYTYLPLIGIFACLAWSFPAGNSQRSASKASAGSAPPPARSVARSLSSQPPFAVLVGALSVAALLACAWLARQQVNYWQDDRHLFEHALSLSDKNAPAHSGVALSLAREGKYGFALAHCRASTQADPSYTAAMHVAGDVFSLMGDEQRAITNYQAALRWKEASPWTWFKLGRAQAELGQMEEAEKSYRMALHYKPDISGAHNNLGALLLSQGKRAEALEHFQAAVRIDPDSPEYHFNVGTTLTDGGDLAKGEAALREAVRRKPDYFQAIAALAGVLAQEGKTAEVQGQLQELDRLCPNTPRARFELGNALLGSGLTNQASKAYADALRLQPELAKAALEAGKSFVTQGKLDAAMAGFLAVVRLQPQNPEAHERLGLLLAHRGKLEEAVEHLREALRLLEAGGPVGAAGRPAALLEVRYNLGLTLAMQGNLREAVTHYQRILQLAPNSAATLNDLAWVLATAPQAELRNGPEALRLAQRACELTQNRDPRFLSSLAAAYAETGQFTEAARTVEKARDLALTRGDKALAAGFETKLALYRDQKPFRQ